MDPIKVFNDQGSMISEVQKAMEESETPMFLYMIALALDKATNGKPIANQVVEIQKSGLRVLLLFVFKLINLGFILPQELPLRKENLKLFG
jgi:exoribonuclease II